VEPVPRARNTAALVSCVSVSADSYVYGSNIFTVEQVSSGGTVTYLHHDQQGSTRLLTGSTGAVEGKCSYGAYGSPSCEGAATSPLGFDSEYTNSDTGLQYLRARNYDPSTGQFTSGDPLKAFTGAPYSFAKDNPLRYGDASGLCNAEFWTESFWTEGNCVSESPLNPIPYYEAEVRSAEAGCGYFASVRLGLEGALAGAALFAGGEGADEAGLAAETLSNPELVSRLSPEEIDQLAREAGYEIGPGGAGYSNPATRYYVPGTNRSEGFRVLSEGVKGQSGLKGGPYLRYFGGPNHGVGVPLGGG